MEISKQPRMMLGQKALSENKTNGFDSGTPIAKDNIYSSLNIERLN